MLGDNGSTGDIGAESGAMTGDAFIALGGKSTMNGAQQPGSVNGHASDIARMTAADKQMNKPPEEPLEHAIEQVRELLFGSVRRENEKRMQELQESVDALRADMMSLFADLEARMADGDAALERRQLGAAQGIGSAVAELGAQLLKLSMSPAK